VSNAKSLVILAAGAVLLIFGAACINYTKPSTLEHHHEWANENSAPPPSDRILIGGILCSCAGVGLLVLGFVRRRRPESPAPEVEGVMANTSARSSKA
jgi:hypothetical protein